MVKNVLKYVVYCVWNVVAHGDAREGKWRGNWRMEWVASTITQPRNVVYPALLTLMRTPRLPAVDWTDSPADLNGIVYLGERWNVVSVRVPSGSARALLHVYRNSYYLNCKETSFAAVYPCFQGYVPVSCCCLFRHNDINKLLQQMFVGKSNNSCYDYILYCTF